MYFPIVLIFAPPGLVFGCMRTYEMPEEPSTEPTPSGGSTTTPGITTTTAMATTTTTADPCAGCVVPPVLQPDDVPDPLCFPDENGNVMLLTVPDGTTCGLEATGCTIGFLFHTQDTQCRLTTMTGRIPNIVCKNGVFSTTGSPTDPESIIEYFVGGCSLFPG